MRDVLREWWEKKFFRIVAYLGFGLFAFVVFLLMTFPQHRVKQIAVVQIESALDNRYEVNITDMKFWRLTGIQMRGIRINQRKRADDPDGGIPMTIQVDRISARFAPLRSILNRGPTVNFQLDVGGGVINGHFIHQASAQNVQVRLNQLDLRESTMVAAYLGIPLFGVLDGTVDLEINPATGSLANGTVDLTGRQLTLGSTVIQSDLIPVFTEVELPTTSFGNLRALIHIEETERRGMSRVVFEEFQTQGRDINTEIWGHIDLGGQGRPGSPRIQMRMQVNQEYVTENDLGFLFNMREFRTGKADNWYGFVFGGSFGNVNFQGSSTAARGPDAEGRVVPEDGEAAAEAAEPADSDGEE